MSEKPFLTIEELEFLGRQWWIATTDETLLIVLLYLPDRSRVLLRQLRPLIDVRVVGPPMGSFTVDSVETAAHIARSEAEQESGYEIDNITFLFSTLRSPGLTNQRAMVFSANSSGKGMDQVIHDDEDFEVVIIPGHFTVEDLKQTFEGDQFDASVWFYFLGRNERC
jgi:hypothetical protein